MKIFSRLLSRSFDPLKLAAFGIATWSVGLGSCSQTPVTVNLHALQSSGQATFLCRGDDNPLTGHKLDECPERSTSPTRRLFSLVTQTATNEVAVIDLAAQSIVDVDPATPGYSFLRVGARPGAIVTTPGGAASFVGVTGFGKNGIVALPSTCLTAPQSPTDPALDLTTWSSCHLSSAPGDITVVLDPTEVDGAPRVACDQPSKAADPATTQEGRQCKADVTGEKGPRGRRKLLVALPEEHKLVLLDAQRLLDRPPGEFNDCDSKTDSVVDRVYPLAAAQPATPPTPTLPDELKLAPGTSTDACVLTQYPHQDSPEQTPAGMANAGDTVYIADRTAPVVHRIDVRDPCAAKELPPLLPYSYLTPERTVTTSRVAVSPLTPTGKQYVYAVDDQDQPSSVMAFDVSPGSKQSTPLMFDGAARQPYLPPDRLRFSAAVRDVNFVMRDFPAPDASGAGQFGLMCSPYARDNNTPSASYRTTSDYTQGALPLNLRGLFGFAMLTNGQIVVIDVEDFDAQCRRPLTANLSDEENFRGCKNDKPGESAANPYYTETGTATGLPTVTNESSCHVIEAHRPRASALSISSSIVGLRAPTLRAFPQFSNPDPSSVITPDQQPHLIAANYGGTDPANAEAQINVSSTPFQACDLAVDQTGLNCLEINPAAPTVRNSLMLPLVEPRSYAQDENLKLEFEGPVLPAPRASGFLSIESGTATINDPDAAFCSYGVQDSLAIREEGTNLGIAGVSSAWGTAHADYVQITGDFPAAEDSYWSLGAGQSCQSLLNDSVSASSRDACEALFGNIDNPAVLNPTRDLTISSAFNDHLEVTPRNCGGDCALRLQQLRCCFPSGTGYTVRASKQWILSGTAGLHDIAADRAGHCVHTASCDRRKQHFHSRAFEVCTNGKSDADGVCQAKNPNVGCAIPAQTNPADAALANNPNDPRDDPDPLKPAVNPGGPGSACIFENLTSRFIVYRGAQPSLRGMAFTWQTTGGFSPLTMSLTTQTTAVNPQSIGYIPDPGYLTVIDAATLGLTLFDLNSLGIVLPSPYF